ncbi:MAG: hypothetical protein IJU66_03390 [Oscillospiraceae bacterium]|nr:hypothetical protein [Oscillospiraceae bacterium]
MKRILHRAAAALLAALLLVLAGCGKTGTQQEKTAEPSAQEEPSEQAKQEPQPEQTPEPDPSGAYAAYLDLLLEKRIDILSYDWQKGMYFDEDRYENMPVEETKPIVLADVWGDATPELLYFTAASVDGFRYGAELHIAAFENGAVRELYSADDSVFDSQVGGGSGYRLFQTEGEKNLWIYQVYYSEGSLDDYRRMSAEGELAPVQTCTKNTYPDVDASAPDGWSVKSEWSIDDKTCSEEAYLAAVPSQEAQAKGMLVRNVEYYETDPDSEPPADAYPYPDGAAMTFDEAAAFLRDKLGVSAPPVDEKAFFTSLPREFSFLSGVGGWSTDIEMSTDGTFTGAFHDSDMGDSSESYPNGTMHICTFSGRFGDVRRVDDYTYSMRLKEITCDPMDAEWVEDGVHYVASIPYGLENADEVLVYLPGSQMSKLPWEFVSWVSSPNAWGNDRPLFLPFCGLYNVAEKEGWGSPDGLSFSWAEDTLGGYADYDVFTAEKGDPQARVLICANAPVKDLKILALSVESVSGNVEPSFATRELGTFDELRPERPLLVETVFHGDTPNLGVSYVDQIGTEHRVALDISGYDGSLYYINLP